MIWDEEYCPNCGASLRKQDGFDSSEENWICTNCGQALSAESYEDNCYSGVLWYCDNCNAFLNNQPGFSDYGYSWTCVNCGHENIFSEDNIYSSKEEYEQEKMENENMEDEEDESFGDHIVDSIASAAGEFVVNMFSAVLTGKNPYEEDDEIENDETDDEENDEDDDDDEDDEYISSDYSEKKESGSSDSNWDNNAKEYYQKARVVNNSTMDGSGKKVAAGFLIILLFIGVIGFALTFSGLWSRDKIKVPDSAEGLKGKDYIDVQTQFETKGFTNIVVEEHKDLYLGVIKKENTVESISIDGKDDFGYDERFFPDAKVRIVYHAKKWK